MQILIVLDETINKCSDELSDEQDKLDLTSIEDEFGGDLNDTTLLKYLYNQQMPSVKQ